MKIVDVDPDNLNWPARCCRCGAKDYEMHEHTEKVVTSSLLALFGVTRYRIVTLMVPVCKRCSGAHVLWYGLAAACAVIFGIVIKASSNPSAPFLFLLMLAGIVCALIGVRQRPLKVLRVDDDKGTIRLKVYNDMVGAQLRRTVPSRHTPIKS